MELCEEFDFILNFIDQTGEAFDLNPDLTYAQLEGLWIALCLHQDIIPDTSVWDRMIAEAWSHLVKVAKHSCKNKDRFDIRMGRHLA